MLQVPRLVLPGVLVASLGWTAAAEPEVDFHRYMKGRRVYEQQCVWCHGRSGRGNGEWAEGVQVKPRNFRTGVYKFRSTPYGFLPTDADLERTIRRGIAGTMMPTFKDLPQPDLEAVIYYLKSLSPRWKDPALHVEEAALPETPDWFDGAGTPPNHLDSGRELFVRTCAVCHGESGKGDGPNAKGLKDVWGFEVVPADLTTPAHKSGPDASDLFRTIALGLDGTPMVGYRKALKDDEIWDLVAYIRPLEREPE